MSHIIDPYKYQQQSSGGGLLTNLLHCYELDELTGTVAFDSIGTLDGDIQDNPTLGQPGKINKSYLFQPEHNNEIEFNDTTGLVHGLTNYTMSFWVKSNNVNSSVGTQGLLSIWNNGTRSVLLRVNDGLLQYYTYTSSQVGGTIGTLSPNIWYHIIITYDGSNMNSYINNVPAGSFSQSGPIGEGVSAQQNWWLGLYHTLFSSSLIYSWDGYIDQSAMWDRVLTVDEINDLYNGGFGLPFTSW